MQVRLRGEQSAKALGHSPPRALPAAPRPRRDGGDRDPRQTATVPAKGRVIPGLMEPFHYGAQVGQVSY